MTIAERRDRLEQARDLIGEVVDDELREAISGLAFGMIGGSMSSPDSLGQTCYLQMIGLYLAAQIKTYEVDTAEVATHDEA